ncbi:HAD family phosphatase [bacterium]|nr:HAD family phosphatase [bacterium]
MRWAIEGRQVGAAVFDMDGLMFDTERLAVDAWIRAGAEAGFELSRPVIEGAVGLDREGTRAVLAAAYGPGLPYDAIRARRLAIAAEKIAASGVPVKEGLFELLRFLGGRGFLLAVATSTDRARVTRLLDGAGVAGFFQAVVCGDEVARNKPDPEIYSAAAAKLGVAPECCIALEDSRSGIAAACGAGMLPIMVPDIVLPDAITLSRIYRRFESLLEVARFLEGSLSPLGDV